MPAPASALLRAREQHAAMLRARSIRSMDGAATALWKSIGPQQVNTPAWNLVTDRITSLAADPSDPSGNTLYVGTTGGGVWKSTNAAGATADVLFTPLTDDSGAFTSAALTSLSMGALSVQPNGSGVVLAGTGDPNDATDSWYGAGILRSIDGGNTWALISSSAKGAGSAGLAHDFAGLAFAGFAWSTTSPDLVVAALSQSEYGAALGIGGSSTVLGLYYSLDAGASWRLATIQDGSTIVQSAQTPVLLGNAATAVVWNPIRQRFYAAVRLHGYYESSDGITWTRLQHQPGLDLSPAACPPNPGTSGSIGCPIFRGALAVQPVTGDLFAFTVDVNTLDQGVWQDACNLTSSGQCTNPVVQFGTQIGDGPLETGMPEGKITAGLYNLWLAAVPAQQDTLLFAGTSDIWRCSLANGCAWRNATNVRTCAAAQVAPSQHAVEAAFGGEGLLYFGNDGGLWRSTDAVSQQQPACSTDDAAHFQNLNGGIGSLAEVERFSQDPADASTLLVALGGLGTAAPSMTPSVWNQVLNGEGDAVAIDPFDSQNWYATSMFGVGINRCTGGASCSISGFGDIVIGPPQVDNDVQLIPAPWLLDPARPEDVILGTCRVWRGPANGSGWSESNLLSGMLDRNQGSFCNGNAEIRSLGVAALTGSSSERIYAGMAGSADGGALKPGHVFTAEVQETSGPEDTVWLDTYASPVTNGGPGSAQFNPNGFDISSIYVDPHDTSGQTVYVTVQGVSQQLQNEPLVYRSTDAGAHWTDITANLPNAPANGVLVDPNDARVVYVALDTGVYVTDDFGNCLPNSAVCWTVFGSGLPNAPAMELDSFSQGAIQLLRVATYGRGIWETDLLTANLVRTSMSAAPDALTFPPQAVQTASSAQNVTITNTGSAPLKITAIQQPTDFTESDTCTGQSIAPAGTCQMAVTFTPSVTGPIEETMTFMANIPGGQFTIALSGTGLSPAAIVLTPAQLSFGASLVGSTTAAQFITVANNGGVALDMSETVGGDFAITANTCGASLAAAGSCTLGISFSPTGTGSRAGVLTVSDAAGNQMVRLSGTGDAPATDVLSAPSLNFAAQQVGTVSSAQLVTIANNGDVPLTGIVSSVSGDFSIVNNCRSLLQGNGSCSIAVIYVPTMIGAESGQLSITDELRTQTVSLSGTGLAPPALSATPATISFGAVNPGATSSTRAVTVTNGGGVTITNLSAAITAGFAIVSNDCPSTLRAGEDCALGITFSPSSPGAVNGTLSLNASNLPRPLSVTLSGSGADFTLSVTGSSSAVVTSGQTASFSLQLAGMAGTSGTVALSCTGAPANAICSLNPASVAVSDANTSSATFSIATGVSAQSALRLPLGWGTAIPLFALAFPFAWGVRQRRSGLVALLLLFATVACGGCGVSASGGAPGSGSAGGGSDTETNRTPAGTYTITITGNMAGISHSAAVKLSVQ